MVAAPCTVPTTQFLNAKISSSAICFRRTTWSSGKLHPSGRRFYYRARPPFCGFLPFPLLSDLRGLCSELIFIHYTSTVQNREYENSYLILEHRPDRSLSFIRPSGPLLVILQSQELQMSLVSLYLSSNLRRRMVKRYRINAIHNIKITRSGINCIRKPFRRKLPGSVAKARSAAKSSDTLKLKQLQLDPNLQSHSLVTA